MKNNNMKVYSTDKENFNDNSLEEAIEGILGYYEVNDIFTIYEGNKIELNILDIINIEDFINDIQMNASNKYGECADEYLNSYDLKNEYINELKELINNWADKNNLQPYFNAVENVEEIKVLKVAEDDYTILEK